MNTEIFAEWLRRQGHTVMRTASSYWYDAGPRVLQAFPYHWLIQPSPGELRGLMLGRGIAALRYSTPVSAGEGMVSYHVELRRPYTLEGLRAQARNGVRRGLSACRVERIPFERLGDEGWALQADTLERQGRAKSMSQAEWAAICRAAVGLEGFEAWAAIMPAAIQDGGAPGGELAAALVTARIDDTWCVPYALSHSKFLREHVNNALFYSVSCELLGRPGVERIFFTLQSLDAPESVDEFKFRMGLKAVPVRQRVVVNPLVRPVATARVHRFLATQLAADPGNPVLAKAEGMLRFYLAGRRPLEDQAWPECVCPAQTAHADPGRAQPIPG